MDLHNPIHVALLAAFIVGFLIGVVFGAFVAPIRRRKERAFIAIDRGDEGCTIYGHCDVDGVLHIDRVEFDGEPRA